jgi:tetratricopeptide (TPR) repeat protein
VAAQDDESSDYVHYRLGVKYTNEGKLDQAVEEFRKVLSAYPDNYNAYMHIAEISVKQGKYRLAEFNLKKALAYNPGWGKAYRMLASAYESDKQYDNAIQELQHYLQVCDPAEKDAIQKDIHRVTALISGGAQPAAPAQAANPTVPQSANAAGPEEEVAKAKAPHHGAGVKASAQAPGEKASDAEIQFKQGVAAYQQAVDTKDVAQYDKALEFFRKTVALQPGHAGAYYYAGLIRRRAGQNQLAKVNYEKAINFPELGYNAHFYLGKIYGEEKNYPKAIEHLKAYVAVSTYEPGKREALTLIDRFQSARKADRGDTVTVNVASVAENDMYREVSQVPEEMRYAPIEVRIDSLLTMAIVDTLSDPGRAMLVGVRQFTSGEFDKAIETFKNVLVSYPRGDIAARTMYNIGVCYVKLHNYPPAENQFQHVVDRYPSHEVAIRSVFFKALCAYERHERELAEKLFRNFIQSYASNSWIGKAYEKLGDIYAETSQPQKAIDAYDQAAARASAPTDEVYARYKLGETYMQIGNPQRSLEAYEKTIAAGEKNGLFERIPDSYYRIADYYYGQKQYEKALDKYRFVTRKYDKYHDTPWGLFQIGNCYKSLKNYDQAIHAFDDLMKNYQGNYWAGQAQWKKDDAVWENEYKAVLR